MSEEKNLAHAGADMPEELENLKSWWDANGSRVTGVVCIVLVIVLAFRFYTKAAESSKMKASADYSDTMRANTADRLEKYITDHGKSPYAALAKLRLANVHYTSRNYDLAKSAYAEFLARHPKHELAAIAKVGLAQVAEAEGGYADAEKLYSEFVEANPDSFLKPFAILGRARCLILTDRKDEARSILDLMLAEMAGTSWAQQADELISAIPRLRPVAPQSTFSDVLNALSGANILDAAGAEVAPEEPVADEPIFAPVGGPDGIGVATGADPEAGPSAEESAP